TFAHLVHPRPVTWKSVIGNVAEILGVPTIPFEEWLKRLEAVPRTPESLHNNPALHLLDFYHACLSPNDISSGQEKREAMGLADYETTQTVANAPALDPDNLLQLGREEIARWMGYWERKAEGEQSLIENPEYQDDYKDMSFSTTILKTIRKLQEKRYPQECIAIRKSGDLIHLVLGEYKTVQPELLRIFLRITPTTFDAIVDNLRDNAVFHNNSENKQLPVEIQVAVALYRIGHFGSAATIQKVGIWAGLGFGTVDLVTRRVMAAGCDPPFRRRVMKWPDVGIKEKAMAWVEARSCPAWHKGWCMVDGTLVPLASRPAYFGDMWYD
ncbi:hypothetical protein M422DRAFT_246246, partial [Sphaerobolus stellatus SS14]